jgi:RNA-directed DNA polymerase
MDLKQRALYMKAQLLKHHGVNMCGFPHIKSTYKDPCIGNAMRLLAVEKTVDLSQLLGLKKEILEQLIEEDDYQTFLIPKKKGGCRMIQAPPPELKRLHRRLNYYLQAYYSLMAPYNVMGFTFNAKNKPPRNILANALVHAGRHEVIHIDLKDFFANVSAQQIFNLFSGRHFQYPRHIAATLTLLCTYQGSLPMGAPTSPILTNFICWELDAALKEIAREHGLRYTRYADDISFSSQLPIEDDVLLDIIQQINFYGFKVNYKKMRRQYPHQRQVVTGLTVNKFPNVSRKLLKQVRAMLHDFECFGDEAAARHYKLKGQAGRIDLQKFVQKIRGQIQFVASVKGADSPWVEKYEDQLKRALAKHQVEV